jgi:tricorn protease
MIYVISFFVTLISIPNYNISYPALSPDGMEISFSCFGDIWIVNSEGGKARHLTVSNSYESISRWSPDGKWIAFESDEWGNDDIFVVPQNESLPPIRLTYYSNYDRLLGWTPDSKRIIFRSVRNTILGNVYSVDISGGTPQIFLNFDILSIDFIKADTVLYSKGITNWWRKKYRGAASRDIWIKMLSAGGSKKLLYFDGRDDFPMFSSFTRKIYFLSNMGVNNINNIWKMEIDGGNPERVTNFKEEIQFPSISEDGKKIVFTSMGKLYNLDLETEEIKRVKVTIPLAYKIPNEGIRRFSGDVSEFAISPDDEEIAFVIRGEIFAGKLNTGGKIENIKQIIHTDAVEKDISWHPDKKQLIFSSLLDGDFDIYLAEPEKEDKFYKDLTFKTKKIFDSDENEYRPTYSPDGEKISYLRSHGQLWIMDNNGKNRMRLIDDSDVLWIDWAPDSRWITYSRTALEWREDIFVIRIDTPGEPINISNHPNDDYKPMWSNDGRRIAYASRDNIGNLSIKYVFLFEEDEEKSTEFWKEKLDSLEAPENIEIDFLNIENRTHTIVDIKGEYYYIAQSPRGDRFAFRSENLGNDDLWVVDLFGDKLLQLTKSNVEPKQIYISKDSKNIYYLLKNGNIGIVPVDTPTPKNLSFRVEIKIDREKKREETFKEAWWVIKDGFYDSDFHGVDWEMMEEKYIGLAKNARTTREFHSIIQMMIGELNSSHLGIWKIPKDMEITGRIGIITDSEYKGEGVRIKEVIPGSPAALLDVPLNVGEIILAISGEYIGDKNYYKFLRRTSGNDILIKTNRKEVKLKPVTPGKIRELIWSDWERRNREWINRESNGRIGYLYISSMGIFNLKKFKGDLYKEMDKEGLIIDIRYNGGGHIHDELLNIFRRTTYGYSKERDEEKMTATSAFKWDKPAVLLINEYCYSDAEIFPMGFKQMNLGTLVGEPTFGAVIGTVNLTLMDGSTFRRPSTGWYRISGKSLENEPVYPDILVANPPEQDNTQVDNQLKEALRFILGK